MFGRAPIMRLDGESRTCMAWFTGGLIARKFSQAYRKAVLSALFPQAYVRRDGDF